ncbi:MAG: hypothetical protein CSA24_01420 [Deltaproteobacteria bacterium]|nr:MAG: hypothetical protein CSB49_06975 [Pseudomonadota bacterium]PIE65959.1 MAG: hypothetical protein CSA24_01420 [Deltaproteobacteria bacterium]
MKIGGPKPPIKPPVDAVDGKPKATQPKSASFADTLTGTKRTEQARAATTAQRPPPAALEQLVAELRAGKVDGPAAAQQLIERVVATRTADLAPEVRDQLKQALERVLQNDPTLAAKLRRLGEAAEADR